MKCKYEIRPPRPGKDTMRGSMTAFDFPPDFQ
jgi:hypothetical protein